MSSRFIQLTKVEGSKVLLPAEMVVRVDGTDSGSIVRVVPNYASGLTYQVEVTESPDKVQQLLNPPPVFRPLPLQGGEGSSSPPVVPLGPYRGPTPINPWSRPPPYLPTWPQVWCLVTSE